MSNICNIVTSSIHPKWKNLLATPYKGKLLIDILDETLNKIIQLGTTPCPDTPDKILRCLRLDPDLIKVVIMGQDVYPQPGIATGLAFACEAKPQPSLDIIMREMTDQVGIFDWDSVIFENNLLQWEQQGVLLLNSALSCEVWKPKSHTEYWTEFMSGLISVLNDFKITQSSANSLVFVFVGKQAQTFNHLVQDAWHYKINCNHPAAEKHGSVKFTGWFSEVNQYLEESNQQIKWVQTKEVW